MASAFSSSIVLLPPLTQPNPCSRSSKQEKAVSQQYLTPQEEKALVAYVLQCAENGFPLPVKALRRLAWLIKHRGLATSLMTETDEAPQPPGKNWPQGLYARHPELRARRLKAIDWTRADENVIDKAKQWFELISNVLANPEIAPENVYNMDETGVLLGRSVTQKMLVHRDDTRRTRGTGLKRVLVTAVECISATGEALPPLIIWPAATHRSVWTTHPTPGWHFACSKKGYTDKHISLRWIKDVFDPLTCAKAQGKPRVLINDGFATHESADLLEFCFQKNIILCRLPSHTSHKLQPLDIGVFGPLKTAYRDQVEQLYRGGAGTVGKQHFTLLYSRARAVAFTASNIRSAWSKAGLFPHDPDRVLETFSGRHTNETATAAMPVRPGSSPIDEFPNTPTTAEGLAALRRLIEGEGYSETEVHQSRLRKVFNAAEQAMANCTLLEDERRNLFLQNCERKTRVSTKSKVVGTARVMSYQDIVDRRDHPPSAAPAASRSERQDTAVSKRRVAAGGHMTNKRSRQGELQQAIQEIDSSHMRNHCHVFQI